MKGMHPWFSQERRSEQTKTHFALLRLNYDTPSGIPLTLFIAAIERAFHHIFERKNSQTNLLNTALVVVESRREKKALGFFRVVDCTECRLEVSLLNAFEGFAQAGMAGICHTWEALTPWLCTISQKDTTRDFNANVENILIQKPFRNNHWHFSLLFLSRSSPFIPFTIWTLVVRDKTDKFPTIFVLTSRNYW